MSTPVAIEPFVKLYDPSTYVACDWDLALDSPARLGWVEFFIKHLETLLSLGVAARTARGSREADVLRDAERCRVEFAAKFTAFRDDPHTHGRVTILTLDEWRDGLLRKHGFVDAMIDLKNRENEKMLPLLPAVCREVDGHSGAEQIETLVRGVFAGNKFDMGAKATAAHYLGGAGESFFATRSALKSRPWLIDGLDELMQTLSRKRHEKIVFFVDNAGSDFLLGALVMIRWLAMQGVSVVIAANEHPTLNDMTVHDIRAWWPRITDAEPSLVNLPIEVVSTGTAEPLIDLSKVSRELNAATFDADLVIIEGMGRGVESNLYAKFNCDALNLAMIKDELVAKRNGGEVFDCVCRFRVAGK
ncbi:MAG: ARMT1-like domain-containing protein [Tepidisphaeraceae bacterium]